MQTFYKLLLNVLMLLFLYNNSVKAQSGITVKAVYKSKLSFVETMNDSIKQSMIENMGPQMFDVYFKAIKNAGEGEFILSLNSNESVFKRRRILQTPNPNNGEISINIQSTSSLVKNVYKNNTEKYMLIEDNIRGKNFLVNDSLTAYNWELINETKKIGKYTVSKAIIKVYEEIESKENSLLNLIDKKEIIITAWFTPDIPFSNGPGPFHGLPGLILSIDDGNTTLLCTEVNISDGEVEINELSNGKEISSQEFTELKKLKDKEKRRRL